MRPHHCLRTILRSMHRLLVPKKTGRKSVEPGAQSTPPMISASSPLACAQIGACVSVVRSTARADVAGSFNQRSETRRSLVRMFGSLIRKRWLRTRLPYHHEGATETRRRKTPGICKKFVSVEIVPLLHVPQSPECPQELALAPKEKTSYIS